MKRCNLHVFLRLTHISPVGILLFFHIPSSSTSTIYVLSTMSMYHIINKQMSNLCNEYRRASPGNVPCRKLFFLFFVSQLLVLVLLVHKCCASKSNLLLRLSRTRLQLFISILYLSLRFYVIRRCTY